jgi:hypothetical protein
MPTHTASVLLFVGFTLSVPFVTFLIIYRNKPRGSTEDAGKAVVSFPASTNDDDIS